MNLTSRATHQNWCLVTLQSPFMYSLCLPTVLCLFIVSIIDQLSGFKDSSCFSCDDERPAFVIIIAVRDMMWSLVFGFQIYLPFFYQNVFYFDGSLPPQWIKCSRLLSTIHEAFHDPAPCLIILSSPPAPLSCHSKQSAFCSFPNTPHWFIPFFTLFHLPGALSIYILCLANWGHNFSPTCCFPKAAFTSH